MAAGELFCAFLFAILARIERHSVGICGTFVIYTCQTAKDTGSGLSRADSLLHVTVNI